MKNNFHYFLIVLIGFVSMTSCKVDYKGTIHNETKVYPNGKTKSKEVFVNGKKEGFQKYYNESGVLVHSEEYKNGIRDGDFKNFHENGKINVKGIYRKGNPFGIWKIYDETFNLIEKIVWEVSNLGSFEHYDSVGDITKSGKVNKDFEYVGYVVSYEDGISTDSVKFKNGIRDGKSFFFMLEENVNCTTITSNGALTEAICIYNLTKDTASVFHIVNDTTFYTKYFYENGNLEKEGARNRRTDNIFGAWKRYYESGNLMDSILFNENGTADRLFRFSEDGRLLEVDSNEVDMKFEDL